MTLYHRRHGFTCSRLSSGTRHHCPAKSCDAQNLPAAPQPAVNKSRPILPSQRRWTETELLATRARWKPAVSGLRRRVSQKDCTREATKRLQKPRIRCRDEQRSHRQLVWGGWSSARRRLRLLHNTPCLYSAVHRNTGIAYPELATFSPCRWASLHDACPHHQHQQP